MNSITRRRFPVSKLPKELQAGLPPSATVTVTVVEDDEPDHPVRTLEEIFEKRRAPFRTAEAIDAEIRSLRDEWSD